MEKDKPSWFWAITLILIMSWALGGTQAIIYIFEGQIILGEIIIIITTLILVVVYYIFEWFVSRKR
jgi:ACR3 family arsenite efflux pump ArsB